MQLFSGDAKSDANVRRMKLYFSELVEHPQEYSLLFGYAIQEQWILLFKKTSVISYVIGYQEETGTIKIIYLNQQFGPLPEKGVLTLTPNDAEYVEKKYKNHSDFYIMKPKGQPKISFFAPGFISELPMNGVAYISQHEQVIDFDEFLSRTYQKVMKK